MRILDKFLFDRDDVADLVDKKRIKVVLIFVGDAHLPFFFISREVAKTMAEINHVDDAATQIHHAGDGGRCQRDRCDLERFHDALDGENRYAGHVVVNGQRDLLFSGQCDDLRAVCRDQCAHFKLPAAATVRALNERANPRSAAKASIIL